MYSDTHFHFSDMRKKLDGAEVLREMAKNGCFFAMDIGTLSCDLPERVKALKDALASLSDEEAGKVRKFLHFSAGIWPSSEAICNRKEEFAKLVESIRQVEKSENIKISAIGECGLDHKWNKDASLMEDERKLFEMQLEFAKEGDIPVAVHSREAWTQTLECLTKVACKKVIMHCYSYTKDELKYFLDAGCYISLSGNITYAKKKDEENVAEMVRLIPESRLLLETDAPYLAPHPVRGKVNSPLFIRHTYEKVAELRGISVASLCRTVDENIKILFSL